MSIPMSEGLSWNLSTISPTTTVNYMNTLEQILNFISTASVEDIHQIINTAQNELPKRAGQAEEFTTYIENFCQDAALLDNIRTELDSLDLPTKATKVPAQWLSSSPEPYIYPDSNPVHNAKPISDFPHIAKLMELVNCSSEVTGHLDSCLILKYNSDRGSLRLHADDEAYMDQNKSICSFTLGSERTIEFWAKSNKPVLVNQYRMKDNGLVVMRPGAQQRLKHCVRAEKGSSGKPDTTKVRYSLSFRAVATPSTTPPAPTTPTTKVAPKTEPVKQQVVEKPQPPTVSPVRKHVCLVAGDSFASRMDHRLLGKNKITVENIARGGAKMKDVMEQLEGYRAANPDNVVTKIIISVGTNDIRNNRINLNQFRGQFKLLCRSVSELYPTSIVFFQSLLPLPLEHDKDFDTNRRVININRIIYYSCKYWKFYYIDTFYPFCKFNRRFNEPNSRFDKLFEVNGIHPNKEIGIGVLARMYIWALHSFRRNFDPYIFQ